MDNDYILIHYRSIRFLGTLEYRSRFTH